MSSLVRSAEEKGILPFISRFHSLEFRIRERDQLQPAEWRMDGLLRDMFEPRRIESGAIRRQPIHLLVRQHGWLISPATTFVVEVLDLTLRDAALKVPTTEALNAGQDVAVSIEGYGGAGPFGFVGAVTRLEHIRHRAIVRFDVPLDARLLTGAFEQLDEHRVDPAGEATPHKPRVLVAVKDPIRRDELVTALHGEDLEVRVLAEETHVVRWLGTALIAADGDVKQTVSLPNVLVTDMQMPGQCGLDLLAGLGLVAQPMAMVLLNGMGNEPLAREARDLGIAHRCAWSDLKTLASIVRDVAGAQESQVLLPMGL